MNNDTDNSVLFFRVFRNIVLQKQIFNDIKLFNINKKLKQFYSYKELKDYKYKDYLTHIRIGIDKPITIGLLPNNLEKLEFDSQYGEILEGAIPSSVRNIKFSGDFGSPISTNLFPKGLIKLSFSNQFNQFIQDIDNLNNLINLEYLQFGKEFNQVLKANYLPKSLKHLKFSLLSVFDQDINEKGILPNGLEILDLGGDFNYQIKPGVIPNSIIELKFSNSWDNQLNKFVISDCSNLIKIEFGQDFNHSINCNVLPKNLEILIFGFSFNQPIQANSLPKSLKQLKFGYNFNQSFSNKSLPNERLEYIEFGGAFSKSIKYVLPNSLKSLKFGYEYNQKIEPDSFIQLKSIKTLEFGYKFQKPIQFLPPSLTELKFQAAYNIVLVQIPDHIKLLKVGNTILRDKP